MHSTRDAPPAAARAGLWAFLAGGAAMFATMYSTQAILPSVAATYRVSPATAGLSVSVLIVSVAVGAWLWGPVSARVGPRRSLILAAALLSLPTILAALAPSFPLHLAARALQGLCMPGLLTVGVPYAMRSFGRERGGQIAGLYVAALTLGGLVARGGVGTAADLVGWRAASAALALPPLLAALWMARTLPADPPRSLAAAQPFGHVVRRLLTSRAVLGATAAACALNAAFVGVFTYLPFRLEAAPFHLSPQDVGFIYLLWVLGGFSPATGRLVTRVGWRRITAVALATSFTGVALTLSGALPVVVLGLALMVGAIFAGYTATQVGVAQAAGANVGVANAIFFSLYYLAAGAGGYLPGLAWQTGGWNGVAAGSIATLAVGLAALGVAAGRRALAVPAALRP